MIDLMDYEIYRKFDNIALLVSLHVRSYDLNEV